MKILGISAFYHDSAACLVVDGEIVAAAQEERFTRKKHDQDFPAHAIAACLEQGGLRPQDIDHVVFYDKPFLKFERLLETYLAFAPRGVGTFVEAFPVWLKDKLFQKRAIAEALKQAWGGDTDWASRLMFSEHHLSHAASAFFPSPFHDAVILTMDGVGEWTTTSLALGQGNAISILDEIHFPHSLGLLYSAMTYYTGFRVNSGEYKVMGLAPYGEPKYAQAIKDNLIDIREDGSFRLDMSYFDYCTGFRMTNDKFDRLFGGPARKPESLLTQREMDLAASVQAVTEDVVLKLARGARKRTGQKNICLAGGVALNCVANGKLLREGIFDQVWVQPAAGDAGGALGAALGAYHMALGGSRRVGPGDAMQGAYLGPAYAQKDIEARLTAMGAIYTVHRDDDLIDIGAQALSHGRFLGWHQGRMEFVPRALGARSILADPRSPEVQKQLNLKIKFRESFRPFAPSVLREHVKDWFEMDTDSPYMLMVADVQPEKWLQRDPEQHGLFGLDWLNVPRSVIPAVTHVDYSARIQTVHRDTNARYHALISRFEDLTGCPVLVNTSFNVRGEPIVATPEDAFRCLMGTQIDMLLVGNCVVERARQPASLVKEYAESYEPD